MVNYLGFLSIFVNLFVVYLLKGVKKIGLKRGAMIGGWIGSFVGAIVLSTLDIPLLVPHYFTILAATGILAFISILVILYQTSNPHINFRKNISAATLASLYRTLKWSGLALNLAISMIILLFT